MNRVLRVVAIWKDATDPSDDRLTIDVVVNDQNLVLKKCMTFGFMGSASPNAEKFHPFALRIDGTLANGSDTGEPDDTDESVNIHGKKAEMGELFTYLQDGEEYIYRIAQIVDLGEP
ncbi:hypothetical protein Q4543_12690 [Salipiger sp. 1_MG-2023]|uniref:hypothetical protein n=1 Tax=Salipiger sp. 1_MG-2023 TaxID=3062665 RepID=UPI0026E18BC4|nr:hypothetical protein [Salipiger sp. 1_MG-2023]MDO6586372.1 hypothetical protein [Salipiger sp. 1_MG-2023]